MFFLKAFNLMLVAVWPCFGHWPIVLPTATSIRIFQVPFFDDSHTLVRDVVSVSVQSVVGATGNNRAPGYQRALVRSRRLKSVDTA